MSTLLAINVNEHTEKKGGLTYLSWAWAWAKVLEIDPDADWEAIEYAGPDGTMNPCMFLPDGSAMVKTTVTINGKAKRCTLPVMDHKNNAIKNPDARKISDAIMRCMTKAISMHGLGLYIYAGEDVPQVEAEESAEARAERERMEARGAELDELALFMIDCHQHEKDMDAIRVWYDPATWSKDVGEEADERKYVWERLRPYSKLRSTIKANHPDRLKAAA